MQAVVVNIIRESAKCYAGLLGTYRASHPGYADQFERPKLFPGRMADAARWSSPTEKERAAKSWLNNTPRMIFVSDMGDALSRGVSFEYLKNEIINIVSSEQGRRHLWLWLTKRPGRMAEFGKWLLDQGIQWPDNLVAMTTVTSAATAGRVKELLKVPSKFKGLSCEPLYTELNLDLTGIGWVIVGGGSDTLAEPFHIEHALSLLEQCRKSGTAFFLKQLGKNPMFNAKPLELDHLHGGDWSEWPENLRIREIPAGFSNYNVE
jgi:protein gp37